MTGGRHPANSVISSEASHSYDLRAKENGHLDRPSKAVTNEANTQTASLTSMDLISRLAGLQATNLSGFDNFTETVEDFLDDFDRHVRATGLAKDQDKLDCLVSNLSGPVRAWFRYQPQATQQSYKELRAAMTDAFKTTEQAKHLARSALFQMRQGPLQSVSEYVHAVQLKARGLDMSEKDLVSIVLNGIDPSIRQYIVMDRPTKIQDILKSPAAQQDFMVTQQHGGTIMVLQEELRALREQLSSMTLQQAQVAATTTHQHHVKFQDEQPCRTCHESRTRHPSSSEQRRRSHSRSRERNGTNSQDSSSKCNFCGKFTCRGPQFCYARDKVCYYCNKKGHLRTVCHTWLFDRKNGRISDTK